MAISINGEASYLREAAWARTTADILDRRTKHGLHLTPTRGLQSSSIGTWAANMRGRRTETNSARRTTREPQSSQSSRALQIASKRSSTLQTRCAPAAQSLGLVVSQPVLQCRSIDRQGRPDHRRLRTERRRARAGAHQIRINLGAERQWPRHRLRPNGQGKRNCVARRSFIGESYDRTIHQVPRRLHWPPRRAHQ